MASIPPQPIRKAAILTAFAIAIVSSIGGGIGSFVLRWSGGIAMIGDIDRAIAVCAKAEDINALRADIRGALGKKPAKEKPIYDWLSDLDAQTSISLVQRIGLETRARVGLQVAFSRGSDPRRTKDALDSAAIARAKFDEYVLQGDTPAQAADRVLELMRVPR